MNKTCIYALILFGSFAVLGGAAPDSPVSATAPLTLDNAFRFPEKGNIHPLLSPDGRWIVFQQEGEQGAAWYWTPADKSEKNPLPLAKKKAPAKASSNRAYWSGSGGMLAVVAVIDDREMVVLLDFSGPAPRFVASFPAENPEFPVWVDSGQFLYLTSFPGKVMIADSKGKVNVYMGHISMTGDRGLHFFQATRGGTILYFAGDGIYLRSVDRRVISEKVYESQKVMKFSLSPNGKFALLYDESQEKGRALLFDLEARKVNKTLPMPSASQWSPDGMRLAFLGKLPAPNDDSPVDEHFFVLDAASGRERDLGAGVGEFFSWMPGGKQFVFSGFSPGNGPGGEEGVFFMDVEDGTVRTQLSPGSAGGPLQVSADGMTIVWQARGESHFIVARGPFTK
jgi:Tol biopolymer transport system component